MFPRDFLWGAAAAGYQVEASAGTADWDRFSGDPAIVERARKLGDFIGQPLTLAPSGEADRHDVLEVLGLDLDRARALGLNSYRFSLEWHRLQPTAGHGQRRELDGAALAHYLSVLQALFDRGMTPVVTLNHLTLPLWVCTPPAKATILLGAGEDDAFRGSLRGWETVETLAAFIAYVELVAAAIHERFPDRPIMWLTVNEPVGSMVGLGYMAGVWAPGFVAEYDRSIRVLHNLIRAHVHAYDVLKARDERYQVGFAHAMMHCLTKDSSLAGSAEQGAIVGAAAGAIGGGLALAITGAALGAAIGAILGPFALVGALIGFVAGLIIGAVAGGAVGAGVGAAVGALVIPNLNQQARDQFDYYNNDYFLNAVVKGEIELNHDVYNRAPLLGAAERDQFLQLPPLGRPWKPRTDFIGINYYRQVHIYCHFLVNLLNPGTRGGVPINDIRGDRQPHFLTSGLGWEIVPDGLRQLVTRVARDYQQPILITENGMAEAVDAERAGYSLAHLHELHEAAFGADASASAPRLLGYLHWSIADNFEWADNYKPDARFGLYSLSSRDGSSAATVAVGPATTPRRQLTESGLAYRAVVRDGDLTAAVRKFGTIEPLGQRVRAPQLGWGELWMGLIAGQPAKLFLDRDGNGAVYGFLYRRDTNYWQPIESVEWHGSGQPLLFRQPAHALLGLRAQRTEAQLSADLRTLSGVSIADDGSSRVDWSLTRDPLHGLWTAPDAAPFSHVLLHRLRDEFRVGKVLPRGEPVGWRVFAIDQSINRVNLSETVIPFTLDGQSYSITAPDAASGQIGLASRSAAFTLRRAPSSLFAG